MECYGTSFSLSYIKCVISCCAIRFARHCLSSIRTWLFSGRQHGQCHSHRGSCTSCREETMEKCCFQSENHFHRLFCLVGTNHFSEEELKANIDQVWRVRIWIPAGSPRAVSCYDQVHNKLSHGHSIVERYWMAHFSLAARRYHWFPFCRRAWRGIFPEVHHVLCMLLGHPGQLPVLRGAFWCA